MYKTSARCLFIGSGNAVLKIAKQHIDRWDDLRKFAHHLLVRRRKEMDHAGGLYRNLTNRLGGTHSKRAEEVLGISHALKLSA
ncbi:unannotated protein [freshwater metagenome]|uniref:Unannotated protein n=1 Tax=freshwater metagenome TaxID=449393 RepID=A0A6J6YFE0_9ZZZZ